MSCPICNHQELEEAAKTCTECGSDIEIFDHIESVHKASNMQKKAILVLSAFFGVVLVSWGSSFFSGHATNKDGEEMVAQTTEDVQDPLAITNASKPVAEFVEEANAEVKDNVEVKIGTEVKEEAKAEVKEITKPEPVVKEKVKVVAKPEVKETGPIIHKVRNGESLWRISKKYYGNGNHATQIAKDNNLNPKKNVPVGTKLKINK